MKTKLASTNNTNKQHSSADRFFSTYSVGAVTLLIFSKLVYYKQRILFGTRVGSAHRYGRAALILARKLRNVPNSILLFIITILTIISAGVLVDICNSNNTAYAESSSVFLNISNNGVISNDVVPSSNDSNGTFSTAGGGTISAWTNNATGYTLSIASTNVVGDANKYLTHTEDSNSKLTSITAPTLASNFTVGQWGYKPSKYHSTDNPNNYYPAPSDIGDILNVTGTANPGTPSTAIDNADTYTIDLGAKVDLSTKLGTYENTSFIVRLVSNAVPYSITYVDNVVSTMPVDIVGNAEGTTVTISSNTPTRLNYTFNGWCTTTPATNTDGVDTCPSPAISVQPGGTLSIDQQSSSNNFILYAMWADNYTIDAMVASGGTLQDFTYMDAKKKGKIVMSMKEETNYILKDSRDNQNYTIALLRDGNVWMTKNLNIAGGTTLTCDKTDCDGGYTLPSNQGWQSTPGQLPVSSTTGFSDDNYAYVYNSGNTTNCGDSGQDTPCFSYYSWDVATLGSGRNIATQNTDAPYSICPKGWRLPTSGQHDGTTPLTNWRRGDFYRLLTAYGANLESAYNQNTPTFWNNAGAGTTANFLLSGGYNGSTFYNGGTLGYYWSSTSTSSTRSRYLQFSTGNVHSANNDGRRDGFSMRCLLR